MNELQLKFFNLRFYEVLILIYKDDQFMSSLMDHNSLDNAIISSQKINEKEAKKEEDDKKIQEKELKKKFDDKISLNQSLDSSQSSSDSVNRVSNLKKQIKENKMPYALNILDLMMNIILLVLIILVIVDFAIRYNLYNNLEINIEYLLISIEKSYEYFALGIKLISYLNLVNNYYSSQDPNLLIQITEENIKFKNGIRSFFNTIVDTENINSIYNYVPEVKSDDIIPFYHITLDKIYYVKESYRNSLFLSIYYFEELVNSPFNVLLSDFCYISLQYSCLTKGIIAHSEIDQEVFYILENGIKYIRERNKYYRVTALQYALDLCKGNTKIILILTLCYSSFILISLIGITPLIIYV